MCPERDAQKHRFFCSWSGGKDSCLALWRALNAGYECASLFTMIDESGRHSRSHGLTPELLAAQARAIGIPLRTAAATWGSYERQLKEQLARFRQEGVRHGVFGDIDLEAHREWVQRVCRQCGVAAHLPLWNEPRRTLLREFIGAGFTAIIVVVNTKKMPEHFLGRVFEPSLLTELEEIGVDACGENGEFHTCVCDGPLFKTPLNLMRHPVVRKDEYVFLPLSATIDTKEECV